MTTLICSISGAPIIDGVICQKTGHIYQKSTILKQIRSFGVCPHTNQTLSEDDIIDLKCKNVAILSGETQCSTLVDKLIQQYESLIMESHYMKQKLRSSREQLAISLYREDASIRVITKLKQERDSMRSEVAQLMKQTIELQNKQISEQ